MQTTVPAAYELGHPQKVGKAPHGQGMIGNTALARPRIYLAGPMSGLPDNNYPAFNAEAARLRALGYTVENPAENPEPVSLIGEPAWTDYMRLAIAQLVTCHVIALLPGWANSRGAHMEREIAWKLRMRVLMAAEVTR